MLHDANTAVKKKELDEFVKRERIHKHNNATITKLFKDQSE